MLAETRLPLAGLAPPAPAQAGKEPARSGPLQWLAQRPGHCFWAAALIVLGLEALHAASGHFLTQTSRDIRQHLASLRSLIEHPAVTPNPFVPLERGSRHLHPYWLSIIWFARP